jgi:hypothetical protein
LRIAISHIAVGAVVTEYTLLDEILSSLICKHFFKKQGCKPFFFWHQKKFQTFVLYMLDEMYLLEKIELAHAMKPLPKEVRNTLYKVNFIRNAMAHSFFPENRKEHRKTGKVLYSGKDIRTTEGMSLFGDDCHRTWFYLARRTYGTWYDDSGLEPIRDST